MLLFQSSRRFPQTLRAGLGQSVPCDLLFWSPTPRPVGWPRGRLDSPTEHEDVVHGGVVREGRHLLQTQLLTAPVEAIRTVHPDVAVVAAGAVLHGAESGGALAGSESIHTGGWGRGGVLWEPECSHWCLLLALRLETVNTGKQCMNFPLCWTPCKSKGPILTSRFLSLGTDHTHLHPSRLERSMLARQCRGAPASQLGLRLAGEWKQWARTKMHSKGFLWARGRECCCLDFGLIGLYFLRFKALCQRW